MPIFEEITAARKKLYLESLAETGSYGVAIKAAGVSGSLLHYWRKTAPAFLAAGDQAKQRAAEGLFRARKAARRGGSRG